MVIFDYCNEIKVSGTIVRFKMALKDVRNFENIVINNITSNHSALTKLLH